MNYKQFESSDLRCDIDSKVVEKYHLLDFSNTRIISNIPEYAFEFTSSYCSPDVWYSSLQNCYIGPRSKKYPRYWPILFEYDGKFKYASNFLSEASKSSFEADEGFVFLQKTKINLLVPLEEKNVISFKGGEYVFLYLFKNIDHFLRESLPNLFLLKESGYDFKKIRIVCNFISERYLEIIYLFGLTSENIVLVPESSWLHFDNVKIGCFFSHSHLHTPSKYYLQTVEYLSAELDKELFNLPQPEKVYVSRRFASQRRIHNEDELEDFFRSKGFQIIDPGELSIKQQFYYFSKVKICIGPHGMGMSNIIFSSVLQLLIEIMPTTWNRVSYLRSAQLRYSQYGVYFVESDSEGNQNVDLKNFTKFLSSNFGL